MSRSRKKTPICGIAKCDSAKPYKKERAGEERTRERNLIHQAALGDEVAGERLEVEQAPWNEWASDRDGKQWLGDRHPKAMRK